MDNIIAFPEKKKPTESTEALFTRAINLIDKFQSNVCANFLNIPSVTLSEPRREGWQTYLINHLSKIGYASSEDLVKLTDNELVEKTTEDAARIRLLQFSFMRKHFDESLLPDNIERIKAVT